MIHRIEHALVMDTDEMPGRGGYAVVGLSDGVEQAERVFVAENFGISDFLHDPQNDRVFFSFFRVPNGRRRAFVRRFVHGTRRNATQNRVFVHTLFLDDPTFDAIGRLPWLLADATFGPERRPLRLDPADPLLDVSRFAALEWSPEPALLDGLAARFRKRLEFLEKRLPNAANAVAATIAALQHQRPVLLPQGPAYEQVVLLAWSMLPPPDRAEIPWTQHDAQNVHVAFELAATQTGANVDLNARPDDVARRIVEMNTASEETHAEFHRRTARYELRIRSDVVRAWFAWRDQLERVREVVHEPDAVLVEHLERLARTVRPDRNDPWVDGEEILQLLWPNVEEDVRAGRDEAVAVNRWASLFERSGLGVRIFAAPPRAEWLDRVSERFSTDALVRFFTFGADSGAAGAPVRDALAAWLLAGVAAAAPGRRAETGGRGRPPLHSDVLARFATQLARDRSSRVEPVVRWLLELPDGLHKLAEATPLNAAMGDLVLLATNVAIRNAHPWTAGYVIGALLRHLELSEETRKRVNAPIADSVGTLLRDDADAFVRFVKLLSKELQERLVNQVVAWLGEDEERTLPLARDLATAELAIGPHISELVFALATLGESAGTWGALMVRIAASIDAHPREDVNQRFDDRVSGLDPARVDVEGLLERIVELLRKPMASAGHCMRTLITFCEDAWKPELVRVVAAQVQKARDAARWDRVVARLAAVFGHAHRDAIGELVVAFFSRIENRDVPNVSEAIVAAARRLEGPRREVFVESWRRRIRSLPPGRRCEQLIAVVEELERGDACEIRIARNRRNLELGQATFETLNELDDDLWTVDERTYAERMQAALGTYAGTSPLQRVQRLIELLANPRVLPSVKLAVETRLPSALRDLGPREWQDVVKMPPEALFARGSLTMILARQLGRSRDALQSARDLAAIAARLKNRDALDGLAAGWIDSESRLQRVLRTVSGGRLRMTTNGPVPM